MCELPHNVWTVWTRQEKNKHLRGWAHELENKLKLDENVTLILLQQSFCSCNFFKVPSAHTACQPLWQKLTKAVETFLLGLWMTSTVGKLRGYFETHPLVTWHFPKKKFTLYFLLLIKDSMLVIPSTDWSIDIFATEESHFLWIMCFLLPDILCLLFYV